MVEKPTKVLKAFLKITTGFRHILQFLSILCSSLGGYSSLTICPSRFDALLRLCFLSMMSVPSWKPEVFKGTHPLLFKIKIISNSKFKNHYQSQWYLATFT